MSTELSTLGSVIKTAYEAEADTNAFTDAEKTKLTNIETAADVTDTANVTAAGALMDSEVTNLAAVKAFDPTDYATSAEANATHTGDATGDTALTLQPAAITGKGAVTVDGSDLLLVTDVSASPQVLGQVTAQSIANLAPAVQGSAILSSDTSPLVTDGYVLTADGAGGAAWEAAAAGSGDFKADGSVDMTGQFRTDVGTFDSDVADGASAVAYSFDTQNTYSTSGAKLLSLNNNATEKFYVDKDGYVQVGGTALLSRSSGALRLTITGVSKNVELGASGIANDYISLSSYGLGFPRNSGGDWNIGIVSNSSDTAPSNLNIIGNAARTTNTTNLDGGNITITGGAGASASAGDADGGNVTIRGGTGYGTGSNGLIIMDNLPTSDPGVAGALWANSNVLTVSTG